VKILVGIMNNPNNRLKEEINKLKSMKRNIDFIELSIEAPEATVPIIIKYKREINDLLSNQKTRIVHFPWFFEFPAYYDEIRKSVIKEVNSILETCTLFDCNKIVIHGTLPKWFDDNHREEFFEATKNSLLQLNDKASDLGMQILLENVFVASFNDEEFEELFKCGFRFCLDIGHAFISGGNEKIFDYMKKFKRYIMHVHMHDNFGVRDLHLPLGTGRIDLEKVIQKLKSFYNGTVTLEVHTQDARYFILSKEKLKEMWKK